MAEVRITKRVVDSAEPLPNRYTVFDSALPGFGLRVYPSGSKSYVFEYRPGAGGRSADKKRVTIGKVGDLTPDQARKEAGRLRAAVINGQDPQGLKSAERTAPTVADIAKAFLNDHVKEKRSTGTHQHYKDLLDRIVLPEVGKLKAKDLDHADVAKLHRAWKSTPYQANRILACISSMYGYASGASVKLVPKGMNPAEDIEKYEEKGRERLLSSEELMRLGDTLRLAETTGLPWAVRDEKQRSKHLAAKGARFTILDEHVIAAVRLLLFTGARLREILNLTWKQVDHERGLLTFQNHKTARKTGTKVIVLSAPAMEVLSNLAHVGVYVIAGATAGEKDEKPRSDLKKPWASIKAHARLEDVRLNDLRHNFASFGVGGGMGLPIVGKLLGHTQTRTTERYAHLAADPLRQATNTIAAGIAAATGHTASTRENVMSIKKAREG